MTDLKGEYMKILILIDALDIGGAETHVITLATELQKCGHNAKVMSAGGELVDKLKKEGIKHVMTPNICKLTCHNFAFLPFQIWAARSIISREIRKERPDIVHAHTRKTAFLVSPICKKEKIPLVTTAHAFFSLEGYKNRLSKWGDGTIAVSDDIKSHIISAAKIPPRQIVTIFNGVKTND